MRYLLFGLCILLTGCEGNVTLTLDQAKEAVALCNNNEGVKSITYGELPVDTTVRRAVVSCTNGANFVHKFK